MGGCRSTPPWSGPRGRCCRTSAAPSRPPLAALGGHSRGRWPLAALGASSVCAGAALRAALYGGPRRLPRRGGSLRSPRGGWLRAPAGRCAPRPGSPARARRSGAGCPPGLAAAAARGAAARPRSGACCAAPAVLARWSGCAVVGLPLVALPPLRPPGLRARPAPGPPLRPRRCAAAAPCGLALAPPAVGPPARRGRLRRPLGGFAARGASPGVGAAGCGVAVVGACAYGRGVGGCAAGT